MRARITAAVVVLTALGMAGAGVAAFLVELQRTEQRVSDAVADELAELEHVREDGLDPQTGKPFTSIKQLMIFMLASDAPDENEILVAWWDDGPQKQQSPDDLAERLTADAGFTDRVRALLATGGGTETMDTVLGDALVAVQPLRDDDPGGRPRGRLPQRRRARGGARRGPRLRGGEPARAARGDPGRVVGGRAAAAAGARAHVHRARHQRHRPLPPDPGRG